MLKFLFFEDIQTRCSIGFGNSSVVFFEDFGIDNDQTNAIRWSYERYGGENDDSISLRKKISIFEKTEIEDTLEKMKHMDMFIEDVFNYSFKYDKTPSIIDSTRCVAFKESSGYWFYITKDSEQRMTFNISDRNSNEIIYTNQIEILPPFNQDFILKDIDNDHIPEVFIFTIGNYSNHDFCYVKAYEIPKLKAF